MRHLSKMETASLCTHCPHSKEISVRLFSPHDYSDDILKLHHTFSIAAVICSF